MHTIFHTISETISDISAIPGQLLRTQKAKMTERRVKRRLKKEPSIFNTISQTLRETAPPILREGEEKPLVFKFERKDIEEMAKKGRLAEERLKKLTTPAQRALMRLTQEGAKEVARKQKEEDVIRLEQKKQELQQRGFSGKELKRKLATEQVKILTEKVSVPFLTGGEVGRVFLTEAQKRAARIIGTKAITPFVKQGVVQVFEKASQAIPKGATQEVARRIVLQTARRAPEEVENIIKQVLKEPTQEEARKAFNELTRKAIEARPSTVKTITALNKTNFIKHDIVPEGVTRQQMIEATTDISTVKPKKAILKELKPKPKIPKELEPLAKEARKFKTAEEFVKGVKKKFGNNVKLVKVSDVEIIEPKLQESVLNKLRKDFEAGNFDRFAVKIGDGRVGKEFRAMDGNHRLAIFKEKGVKYIPAIIDEGEKNIVNFAKIKVPEEVAPELTDFFNQVKRAEPVKPSIKPIQEIFEEPKKVEQVFKVEKFDLDKSGEELVNKIFKQSNLERRTVKNFERFIEEAKKVDIDDVLLKKTPETISEAENVALTNFVNNAAKRIKELHKLARENPALNLKIDELSDNIAKAVSLQVKAGTASGRAVASFRIQANYTLEPSYWIRQAQKQLGDNDLPKKVIDKINEFIEKGDRGSLAQYVANLSEVSWLEKILTFRKAGLLTNIKTDIKNIVSNTLFKSLDDTTDFLVGNQIDMIAGMFTGKRTIDMSLQDAFRSWGKFGKGAREGWEFLKTKIDKTNYAGNKIEFRKAFNRFSENPIERTLAHYTETIFNRLEAEDKPFKAMAYGKSVWEQLKIEGKAKGLRGAELDNYIADNFVNPSNEVIKKAQKDALLMTFQAENMFNDVWRSILRATRFSQIKANEIPNSVLRKAAKEIMFFPQFVLEMINPFNKVATNLIIRGIEFTPLGFGKAVFDGLSGAGQKFVVKDISRAIIGTIITGGIYYMLENEGAEINLRDITGSKMRKMKFRAGIQDSSFNWKGKSVKIQGIDPLPSFFLSAGILQKINDGEMSYQEGFKKYIEAKLMGESYLSGIKQTFDAFSASEKGQDKMGRLLQQQAASFVPSIVYTMAKSMDNEIRAYDSFTSAIMSRIPILRGTLPPRIDAYGNEIKYNKDNVLNTFNQFLNPFAISEIDRNSIDKELKRLIDAGFDEQNVLPSETYFRLKIGKRATVKLTAEEQAEIQKFRGKNLFEALNDLMISKKYIKANDDEKLAMIQKTYRQVWKATKEELTAEIVMQKEAQKIDILNYLINANPEKAAEFYNQEKPNIENLTPTKKRALQKALRKSTRKPQKSLESIFGGQKKSLEEILFR